MIDHFLEVQANYSDSDVIVIPVPFEKDVSWVSGTINGPGSIIDASKELEFYSTYLKAKIADKVKIHTLEEFKIENEYDDMLKDVESKCLTALSAKKKFALLGGDHSISIGAIRAVAKKYPKFSILHIDAHADMRDEYHGSKYNHACVMRRASEYTKDIVSVGVRSYSKEEADYIKENKISIYSSDIDLGKINKKLGDNLYISIDLDGFDPSEVPAVGTPQPGGLRWVQVMKLIGRIAKGRNIIGFDVVELSPLKYSKTSDFLAAKLVYNLIGYSFLDRFK